MSERIERNWTKAGALEVVALMGGPGQDTACIPDYGTFKSAHDFLDQIIPLEKRAPDVGWTDQYFIHE